MSQKANKENKANKANKENDSKLMQPARMRLKGPYEPVDVSKTPYGHLAVELVSDVDFIVIHKSQIKRFVKFLNETFSDDH